MQPLLWKHFYNQKTKMVNKYIKFYQLNLYDTSTKKLPENLKSWVIHDINIYKHLVTSHWRKGSKKQYKKTVRAQALVNCLPLGLPLRSLQSSPTWSQLHNRLNDLIKIAHKRQCGVWRANIFKATKFGISIILWTGSKKHNKRRINKPTLFPLWTFSVKKRVIQILECPLCTALHQFKSKWFCLN